MAQSKRMLKNFRGKFTLETVVFTSGALVMIYEIIGSRILAPFIGTSTYVWTSLIGVILGSLSLGYYLGGKTADEKPNLSVLASVLFFAGAFLSVTILLHNVVLATISSASIGLALKSIIAALLLFAPASILFGFVTPYAVRLKMNAVENAGKTVGRLYALSTVGSILGTFLAGFLLLPSIGSTRTLYLITAILFALSFLIAPFVLSPARLFFLIMFPSALIFNEVYGYMMFRAFELHDIDTHYNRLQIYNTNDKRTNQPIRVLITDPLSTQSAMFLESDELALNYSKYYHLVSYYKPNFQDSLIIGGAAYSFPKEYLRSFPGKKIDVVEIDPQMTQIARDYFRLQDNPNLNIIHEDGRIFLNKNEKKYDAIFVDAFNSMYSIPFQLTTTEAVSRMNQSLKDDGVVLLNMVSAVEGKGAMFLQAEYKTFAANFPHVYVFRAEPEKALNVTQNLILIAAKSDKINSAPDEKLAALLKNKYENPIDSSLPVLTDDFAPVEYYISFAQQTVEK
jgi:spermidine synthase